MTGETTGHELALDELAEIQGLAAGQRQAFRVEKTGEAEDGWLPVAVSLDCAEVLAGPGGQPLAEREHVTLLIPEYFPFSRPAAEVRHDRFAGLPYVLGGRQICLYHSDSDWNPADGMFGVIARLAAWYRRAAAGRLVEAGQPLHPPLAYPVFNDADCVVIRPDLPRDFEPSSAVMVRRYPGRVDVVEWLRAAALDIDGQAALGRLRSRLVDVARAHEAPAFLGAVRILHDPLSFEFPDNFPDLLSALSSQHVSGEDLLEQLAHVWLANELAAVRTDEPAHFMSSSAHRCEDSLEPTPGEIRIWSYGSSIPPRRSFPVSSRWPVPGTPSWRPGFRPHAGSARVDADRAPRLGLCRGGPVADSHPPGFGQASPVAARQERARVGLRCHRGQDRRALRPRGGASARRRRPRPRRTWRARPAAVRGR